MRFIREPRLYKRVCPSVSPLVRPSVCPLVRNPFFFTQQKWEKMVKNDFPYLCRLFQPFALNLSFNLPFTIFLLQSSFHNLSFTISISFIIIFGLSFLCYLCFTIFPSQSFFHNLSSTISQSLQNLGRIVVPSGTCY